MKHCNNINARSHIPYIDDYHVLNLSNLIHNILIYIIAQHRDNKGGMKLCDGKEQGGTSVAGHILNAL